MLAGLSVFLMLSVISGFLWLVLDCVHAQWRYWAGWKHRFRHGNANPARILSVQPPLVAVWTDLANGWLRHGYEGDGVSAAHGSEEVAKVRWPLTGWKAHPTGYASVAMTSISTRAPRGSPATATVERAGL